ncbi:DUF6783 domain-containing protein [uncultured Robinsoniella sp.]|uniref:DUF6783 domain-containing protein n=1 Tax=Robinsoniella sp. TaxID=2496533 RepID=UPI00374F2BE9
MRGKYTAKWGVQMKGMIFHTRSGFLTVTAVNALTCRYVTILLTLIVYYIIFLSKIQ